MVREPPGGHPQRLLHPGEDAAGTVVSFLAAVAVFALIFAVATMYMAGVAEQGADDTNVDLAAKADNVLNLLITSPGSPADWGSTTADPTRLGMIKDGSTSIVDIDKVRRLQNRSTQVAYDDAREALGIEQGYDLHIRTTPRFSLEDGRTNVLESYHVMYVGGTTTLGNPSTSSNTETQALEELQLTFRDSSATALNGTSPGDEVRDTEYQVAAHLLPRLAGFGWNEDDTSTGVNLQRWHIVNLSSHTDGSNFPADQSHVLAAGYWGGSQWRTEKPTEDRLHVTTLDLGGYDANDEVWVNMTHWIKGHDSVVGGDYAHVMVREEGNSTWVSLSGAVHQSGSKNTFADDSWTVNMTQWAGERVELSLLWDGATLPSSSDARGWFVGDLTVEGQRDGAHEEIYSNDVDMDPADRTVDAVMVGADVDHSVFQANDPSITSPIQAWITAGGHLLSTGSDDLNDTWLDPFLGGTSNPANGPLLDDRSDLSHPLLHEPHTLQHRGWTPDENTYGVEAGDAFTRVILRDDGAGNLRSVLSVSLPTPTFDGNIILTSYKAADLDEVERLNLLENALLQLRFGELFLEYGATIPGGAEVESSSTTGLVDAGDAGHVNFRVTVYVWRG